jgi:signal peptidase I
MAASTTIAHGAAPVVRGGRAGRFVGWIACAVAILAALVVAVVGVGPRVLPYRTYAITGGSMEPTIRLGAEAFVRPVSARQLRVGDVITFHKPGEPRELVTHRIVAVRRIAGTKVFVTKGDANAVPDAWRIEAAGTGWRYAFSIPYLGYAVEIFGTPLARFVVLALAALVLAGAALRRLWRSGS